MTLDELFASDDSELFEQSCINHRDWIIYPSPSGYGYTIRNPKGFISLETSKDGTVEQCKEFIDAAMSFKPVN